MEIDISIRGATLEEAREIFSKVPESVRIKARTGSNSAPGYPESVKSLLNPDHREENLGRSTIPSDELKPDPEPVKPGKTLSKIKKARADLDTNKIRNTLNRWSDEEMLVIQDCPGWRDAIATYQLKFGDKRNRNSIAQQWKKIAAGIVKKRIVSEPTIEGAAELVDKMPEERPPTTGDPGKVYRNPRNPVPVQDPPEIFKVGLHVKQVKPFQDRIVPDKIGVVTARVNGLIEVNFGGTRYVKIAPDCLEVV